MKRAATALVLLALTALLAPAAARAEEKEGSSLRLSMGGGVAGRWAGAGPGDAVVPIEVTLTRAQVISLSVGGVLSPDGVAHAYGELAFYAGVSLGAGAGYGAYQAPGGRQSGRTLHLFVGVPIPLEDPTEVVDDRPRYVYLLPYYRPSWGPWPGTAHEAGFMLKISFGLVRQRRKSEPWYW